MAKRVLRGVQRSKRKTRVFAHRKRVFPLLRDTLDRGQYEAPRHSAPPNLDAHPGHESKALGAAYTSR